MNPSLGAFLLAFFSLPIAFQMYFGYTWQYVWAYILPSGVESGDKFDFIVVGSGSSGSVVAGRLAQAGHQVLLVEAGGPSNLIQFVPGLVLNTQQSPYDWQFKSEPQAQSMKAMNNQQSNWPRGKMLGGSSMVHYMLYVRGNPRDFDEWESFGNPGWKYEDVLPHFKSIENFHRADGDPKYRSTEGPHGVMQGIDHREISEYFWEAGKEIGLPLGDYNGEYADRETLYVGQIQATNGKREGTYYAFADPYVGRGLTVLTYAHVTKVLLNDKKEAMGVEAVRFGKTYKLFASKEVVVSGGAVGSPQILMLSGIGPKDHLESVGVPVEHDLKGVGQNLHDHIMTSVWAHVQQPRRLGASPFENVNPLNILNYIFRGRGPLASNGVEAGAFFYSGIGNDTWNRPDLQVQSLCNTLALDFGLKFRKAFNFVDDKFYGAYGHMLGEDGTVLYPSLSRPKSRGYLKLKSSDPMDAPIIQPNYYSDPSDVETLKAGVRWVVKLSKTEAYKKINLTLQPDKHNCGQFEPFSDEYNDCHIRHWSHTIYHPVGTCKMGPKTDENAVVDHELRVHGVPNLRVIDASIMPAIVGVNTHAACVMIGEKGADMIIKHWADQKIESKDVPPKSEL